MSEPPAAPLGRWVHAREEDSGDVRVYRPAGHPLPPARGRRALEFLPDGTFVEYGIGPDDRLAAAGAARPASEVEIVSLAPDRLEIRVGSVPGGEQKGHG